MRLFRRRNSRYLHGKCKGCTVLIEPFGGVYFLNVHKWTDDGLKKFNDVTEYKTADEAAAAGVKVCEKWSRRFRKKKAEVKSKQE